MTRGESSHYTYPTPHGPLTIGVREGRVVASGARASRARRAAQADKARESMRQRAHGVFRGKRTAFDIPVEADGTAFQRSVWKAVCNIPYGQTRTNEDIARAIGSPRSYRMVGSAVRKNPLAVIVPTHRVVNANGRITGSDADARLRIALLEFERHRA